MLEFEWEVTSLIKNYTYNSKVIKPSQVWSGRRLRPWLVTTLSATTNRQQILNMQKLRDYFFYIVWNYCVICCFLYCNSLITTLLQSPSFFIRFKLLFFSFESNNPQCKLQKEYTAVVGHNFFDAIFCYDESFVGELCTCTYGM